jgi:hypothetical protein
MGEVELVVGTILRGQEGVYFNGSCRMGFHLIELEPATLTTVQQTFFARAEKHDIAGHRIRVLNGHAVWLSDRRLVVVSFGQLGAAEEALIEALLTTYPATGP